MEIGFGCWIWIWGLLEIGLVASWIWEEHEENFLLVFNLIFSSCFCLCSSDMGLSSWLLDLVCEEHEEQVEEQEEKLKNMNIKKLKFLIN